jgi:type IV pilus assembly protein PilM
MNAGVGIDIGSRTTRVAHVISDGTTVRWAGGLTTASGPDGAPSVDPLPAQLRQAHIPLKGSVVGISGKDVILRYSRVPPVPAWKLKMLVGYEATQGNELNVSFDYRLLHLPARFQANEMTVLMAVAKNDTLDTRLDLLARHGLRHIDFNPDALALYEAFALTPEAEEAQDQFCLVLDIGAAKTEMIIVYNGGLIFARSIAFGGADFTEAIAAALGSDVEQAEQLKCKKGAVLRPSEIAARPEAERPMQEAIAAAAEEFFGALRASLMFAKAQTRLVNMTIGRVFLSGAGARLKRMGDFLEEKFEAHAAPLGPPPAWGVPGTPGQPSRWMLALGLALLARKPVESRLSLLPPKVRRRRRFWQRDVLAWAAAMLFIVAIAAAGAAQFHNAAVARDALDKRAALLEQGRKRERELLTLIHSNQERQRHLTLLKQAASAGRNLVNFTDYVRSVQPGPIALNRLTFQPGKLNEARERSHAVLTGTIGASTSTYQDVLTEFQNRLVDYPELDPPDPKNIRLVERGRESADGSAWEFRIRVPLRAMPREEAP